MTTMTVEAILFVIIFLLICVIAFIEYTGIQEREKLLKLLMARNLQEVTDNEYTQKLPKKKPEPIPDTVEISPDDPLVFDKAIQAQLEYGERVS